MSNNNYQLMHLHGEKSKFQGTVTLENIFEDLNNELISVSPEKYQKAEMATHIARPKRPLTAYNLFFKSERARLVGIDPLSSAMGDEQRKKRPHRRTHGKIGFTELAKTVGQKWRNLDSSERKVYEDQAAADLRQYRKDMDEYKQHLRGRTGGKSAKNAKLIKPNTTGTMESSSSNTQGSDQNADNEVYLQPLKAREAIICSTVMNEGLKNERLFMHSMSKKASSPFKFQSGVLRRKEGDNRVHLHSLNATEAALWSGGKRTKPSGGLFPSSDPSSEFSTVCIRRLSQILGKSSTLDATQSQCQTLTHALEICELQDKNTCEEYEPASSCGSINDIETDLMQMLGDDEIDFLSDLI